MSGKASDPAPRAVPPNTVSVPVKPTTRMIEVATRMTKLSPAQIVELYNAMIRAALDAPPRDGDR